MKDNKIILDTHELLGFRLADTKQLLGVASGVKLSTKQGVIKVNVGAKIGGKDGIKSPQPSVKIGAKIGGKVGTKPRT